MQKASRQVALQPKGIVLIVQLRHVWQCLMCQRLHQEVQYSSLQMLAILHCSAYMPLCTHQALRLGHHDVQLPEGEFVKGFVQDLLKQLGKGNSSLPQQIIQLGMQGMALLSRSSFCNAHESSHSGPQSLPRWHHPSRVLLKWKFRRAFSEVLSLAMQAFTGC